MSIQYAGGTIYNGTFTTGSTSPCTDIANALITALAAAGWSRPGDSRASAVLTFSGQPSAADTVTLDSGGGSKVYTFRASVATTANEVLIDSTLALTISNLSAAITAGAGSGTKYGSATTAHTTFNVQASTGTTLTVQFITAGFAGNGAPVGKSCANATWGASTLAGGATIFTSAITPQGLACQIQFYTEAGQFYTPGSKFRLAVGDRTWTRSSGAISGAAGDGPPPSATQYRIIANKYQLCMFTVGARVLNVCCGFLWAGVPYIPTFQAAQLVVSAAGSPISCNVPGHALSTGNQVLTVGGLVNTNMNGIKTVTVTDANNYTLDGTTSNGAYTPNSAYVANITANDRVVEAIFGMGTGAGASPNWGNDTRVQSDWTALNSYTRGADNSSAELQLIVPVSQAPSGPNNLQYVNNNFVLTEPLVAYGVSNGAVPKVVGQVWDMVLVRQNLTLEQTATFDTPSHNFMAVGVDATRLTSLLLATS